MSAEGFEPSTHALEGRCSIQLSYGTILNFAVQRYYFLLDYTNL